MAAVTVSGRGRPAAVRASPLSSLTLVCSPPRLPGLQDVCKTSSRTRRSSAPCTACGALSLRATTSSSPKNQHPVPGADRTVPVRALRPLPAKHFVIHLMCLTEVLSWEREGCPGPCTPAAALTPHVHAVPHRTARSSECPSPTFRVQVHSYVAAVPFICEAGTPREGTRQMRHERGTGMVWEGSGPVRKLRGRSGWGSHGCGHETGNRARTQCCGLAGERVGADFGKSPAHLPGVAFPGARPAWQLDLHDILLVYLHAKLAKAT